MKKRLLTLVTAIGVLVALTIPAGAVELHEPHQGTSCKDSGGFTQLHFVNNKTEEHGVYLFVVLDSGTIAVGPPHKTTKKTNHWTVTVSDKDVLNTAYTTTTNNPDPTPIDSDGPGKLVLSDYKCKEAPPKKS